MDEYNQLSILGKGSFGCVWLARNKTTNNSCVIKEISITALKLQEKETAINEVKILATLRHKNIIRYQDAFIQESKLCIVMEYADDGDLAHKIKLQNGSLFLELQIIDWFVQILIAVKYIHSLNILHRDIKSQNIFLTKTNLVKIGDFGVSRFLNGRLHQAQTAIGTPFYLSPEICRRKPRRKLTLAELRVQQGSRYNHKSDMWSLGVLLYELSTLRHPFQAEDFSSLVLQIIQGKYQPIPGCYGPLLQDLLLVLLQVKPSDRPTASQLLKIPSLQPHVESYLRRVRHKEAPVILDLSLPRDRHNSERDSGDELNINNIIKSENIRSHSERTDKSKQPRVESLFLRDKFKVSNENGIQSIQNNCQKTKHETAKTDKEKSRTKSLPNRTSQNDSIKMQKIKDTIQVKIKSATTAKDISFSPEKDEALVCANKTFKKDSAQNETKVIKNETISKAKKSKVETKCKTEKNATSNKNKSPKTNFIERNRNLASTPPSAKKEFVKNCSSEQTTIKTTAKKTMLSPTSTPSKPNRKSPVLKSNLANRKRNLRYLKNGQEPFEMQEYEHSPKRLAAFNSRKLEYNNNSEKIHQVNQTAQTDLSVKFFGVYQQKENPLLVGDSLTNQKLSCENNVLNEKARPSIQRSQTDIMHEKVHRRTMILSEGLKLADKIKLKINKRLSSASDASRNYCKLLNEEEDNEKFFKEVNNPNLKKTNNSDPNKTDNLFNDIQNFCSSINCKQDGKSQLHSTLDDCNSITSVTLTDRSGTDDTFTVSTDQKKNLATVHATTYTILPGAQEITDICERMGREKIERLLECLRQFQSSPKWKTIVNELADEYVKYLPVLFKYVLNEQQKQQQQCL